MTDTAAHKCGHLYERRASDSDEFWAAKVARMPSLDCPTCADVARAERVAEYKAHKAEHEAEQAAYLRRNSVQIEAERPMTEAVCLSSIAEQNAKAERDNARLGWAMRQSDPSGL